MKQRLYWLSVVVAVLAALALSGPAMAAGNQVPFKARSSGVVTTAGFDPVAGIEYLHVEGQGQATHLGHFTQTGDAAADVVTGNVRGTWTLTAANGDMLFLEMTGYGIDPTHGAGTFTIVSGTGRFQGASGSYQQIITFVSEPGGADTTFTDVLAGMIAFGHE